MKRLTAFFALGCIIALSFTSCLKSDDNNNNNNGLTKAQIGQCFDAIHGEFSGKMIYPVLINDLNTYGTDTIDIDWTVTADTMLIVKELPAEAIAGTITDNELRTALEEQNPVSDVECYIGFYSLDSYIRLYLAPQKVDYPVFLNGQTHTVSAVFWAATLSNYSSMGYKELTSGLVAGQIVIGAVYLDNNQNKNYLSTSTTSAVPLIFATDITKATSSKTN